MSELQIKQARKQLKNSVGLIQEWKNPDGSTSATCIKTGQGYVIQHIGLADFEINKFDLSLTCTPATNTSSEVIDHLYRNRIKPLVLGLLGKSVFHGSAVNIDGAAALFLGESGKGKSTLALSFATNSFGFLSDDCLVLEERDDKLFVLPGDDTLRVWPDSQTGTNTGMQKTQTGVPWSDKVRLRSGDKVKHLKQPLPISAAYFFGSGNSPDVTIKKIEKPRAVVKWVENSFMIDPQDSEAMLHQFEFVSNLSVKVPCFELDYPRQYDQLETVRNAIVDHVRGVRYDDFTK